MAGWTGGDFCEEMNIDPASIKPLQIQTTLLYVNNFIVNSTKFLNNFSESCDIKLTNISTKINSLDTILCVLEAKLNSVPGLETDDIPPPSTTTSSSAPNPPQTEQDNVPPSSQPSTPSDMVKASEHPDYAPFFKLQRLGVPMPVVSAKTVAAGLDPNVLEDPDAMISLKGGGGSNTVPVPTQQPQTTEAPVQEIAQPSSNMVKASEHPDYAPFFKLTRLGVPVPVVSAKVSAAGLDVSVLENPDAMINLNGGGNTSGGAPPLSRRIFDKYDNGGSGRISTGQFQVMALDFGVFLNGSALSIAVKMIDHDGNGTIEYDEFLKWYKQSSFSSLSLDDDTLSRRCAASKLFRKYDGDNSGTIDTSEFKGLHAELKMQNLTSHSCEKAMEDMDSDNNGKIEFNEFVEWLERH